MPQPKEFEDLTLEHGDFRVVWEWIGEGYEGDYNESDPDDVPLLRFSCDKKEDGEWEGLSDASYCTHMPITSSVELLAQGAGIILEVIKKASYKRRLQELSWLSPKDFKED